MAYSSVEQVAALSGMWTRAGEFFDEDEDALPPVQSTQPSLTQVDTWLDQVSAQMDLALAQHWFVTPIDEISAGSAFMAVSAYVSQLVADLVHAANSSGRFFTDRAVERGITPMQQILSDLETWVNTNETGFVAMGVPQVPRSSRRNEIHFRVVGY